MHEGMPTPEKKNGEKESSSPESSSSDTSQGVLKYFDSFRKRPNDPKYSYVEQKLIGDLMELARTKFEEEKTPETERDFKEMSELLKQSKEDKYHVSALWAPLQAAKLFLEYSKEIEKIPTSKRVEFTERIDDLIRKIHRARELENISKKLVNETLALMGEMEKYLESK